MCSSPEGWCCNMNYYLRVTYDANGGSGAPSGFYRRLISDSQPYTYTYTVASGTPTRSGYNFLGWSTNPSATTASYQAGSHISYTFNTDEQTIEDTLYAVWETVYYTVSFNANGGTGAPSSMRRAAGSSNLLPSSVPTRSGYKFVGWAKNSDGTGTIYPAGSRYTWTKNETLYAVWAEAGSTAATSPSRIPMDGTTVGTITLTKSTSAIHHHTVKIKLGYREQEFTNVGTSQQFTIPLVWNNALPNSNEWHATVYVTSFLQDGTQWGEIEESTFDLYVPEDIIPVVSLVTEQTGDATAASWQEYVQGYSGVKFTITATGQYSSTIKKIEVSGYGIAASTDQSSFVVSSDLFTGYGAFDYTIIVTDSRGRTKTIVQTINVSQYFRPVLSGLSVYRSNQSGVADDVEGEYITVKHTDVNFACSDNNDVAVEYKYKLEGASAYTTITDDAVLNTNYIVQADISKAYLVYAKVTDSLGSYTETIIRIDSVICSLSLGLNNDRARFGGAVRKAGLEIDWDTEIHGNVLAPKHIQTGTASERSVASGATETISITFDTEFDSVPKVVVGLLSSQTIGIGRCSVSAWSISETGFSLRLNNEYTSARNIGAYWIAVV